jgi:hypothetical protein
MTARHQPLPLAASLKRRRPPAPLHASEALTRLRATCWSASATTVVAVTSKPARRSPSATVATMTG